MPDIKGACKITPAQSYFDAKSTVGTVPDRRNYSLE
jgi:hypothetical protein